MSLVQMLVHLLAKIVSNINNNNNKSSLHNILDSARMKKGSDQIGDGTFYLSRLLIKFESLSNECKIQINETVNKLDHNPANDNIDK
jgi:hypothetical protein